MISSFAQDIYQYYILSSLYKLYSLETVQNFPQYCSHGFKFNLTRQHGKCQNNRAFSGCMEEINTTLILPLLLTMHYKLKKGSYKIEQHLESRTLTQQTCLFGPTMGFSGLCLGFEFTHKDLVQGYINGAHIFSRGPLLFSIKSNPQMGLAKSMPCRSLCQPNGSLHCAYFFEQTLQWYQPKNYLQWPPQVSTHMGNPAVQ